MPQQLETSVFVNHRVTICIAYISVNIFNYQLSRKQQRLCIGHFLTNLQNMIGTTGVNGSDRCVIFFIYGWFPVWGTFFPTVFVLRKSKISRPKEVFSHNIFGIQRYFNTGTLGFSDIRNHLRYSLIRI